jgi:DNA-binding transcriptional MerR regulator
MLMASRTYSTKEISMLARCTVDQLSYLRDIELLLPRQRSRGGPDEYDDVDLLRLHQIRLGRARGLALEEIRRWLDGCSNAWREESALPLPPPRHGVPSGPALYVETEVKVETDADLSAFQEEAAELYGALAARRRSGAAPSDAPLQRWTERHCFHINRWFCPCDPAEHVAFGHAIVNNPYLAASIERHGPDLTSFMISVLEAHVPAPARRQ